METHFPARLNYTHVYDSLQETQMYSQIPGQDKDGISKIYVPVCITCNSLKLNDHVRVTPLVFFFTSLFLIVTWQHWFPLPFV